MARKRKRNELIAGELNLTAMIDIAFQLLSFFIVTAHPVDVLAHLDVFRPSAEKSESKSKTPPNLIKVGVYPDGFMLNDVPMDSRGLDKRLTQFGGLDKNQTVLIVSAPTATHGKLVEVLDLCQKAGLSNLSVISGQ